jgi:hypothetical protein
MNRDRKRRRVKKEKVGEPILLRSRRRRSIMIHVPAGKDPNGASIGRWRTGQPMAAPQVIGQYSRALPRLVVRSSNYWRCGLGIYGHFIILVNLCMVSRFSPLFFFFKKKAIGH